MIILVVVVKAMIMALPAFGIMFTESMTWNIVWWVVWLAWMFGLCVIDAQINGLTKLVGYVYWLVPSVAYFEQPWLNGRLWAYLIGAWAVFCVVGIWRDHTKGPTNPFEARQMPAP